MIVSISGKPGSGKSTIAQAIANRLGFKRYYAGQLRREQANLHGMNLEEYTHLAEHKASIDRELDEYVRKLGATEDNFVIESRTAFHFIPHSIKIFLDIDLDEAAKRVFPTLHEQHRSEERYSSLQELRQALECRLTSDQRRYKKYYSVDAFDVKNFDYVLDTTHLNIEQVIARVIDYIEAVKKFKS